MATDNSVTLVGNVTRDPELRFTNTGQANVTFGLAVNRRWQNRQTQEWEEATSFFDVVCWREMAENVSETHHPRRPGHGGRAARAAQLGDPGGRAALEGRGRRRRDRPVAAVGDGADHEERTAWRRGRRGAWWLPARWRRAAAPPPAAPRGGGGGGGYGFDEEPF